MGQRANHHDEGRRMTDEQTALTDLADGAADPVSASVPPTTRHPWRQGEVVELSIDDLSSSGDGVGRYAEIPTISNAVYMQVR